MKKLLSLIVVIAITMSVALTSSCRGRVEDESSSSQEGGASTVTKIQVTTYNKGVGKAWLDAAADRFEKLHEHTKFEDGKEGVEVEVIGTPHAANILIKQNLTSDIYFTELLDYFTYIENGKVAKITDVVTGDLSAYGENGRTIESKMDNAQKDFLKAKDGEYYAVPFYDGYMGFVYDVEFFERKGYFTDDNGDYIYGEGVKHKGIDGVSGTYDDGLPRTYDEFLDLVNHIRGDQVLPFIASTEGVGYYPKAMTNWWADYEGKEYMLRNYNLTGETDYVTGFDGNGNPIISTTTIDSSKGMSDILKLQAQPGKYYALKFLREVVMGDSSNYDYSRDFKNAQYNFIASLPTGENPSAMLMEGVWWENEADISGTFATIRSRDLEATCSEEEYKHTRKFAFMPVPKVSESNFGSSKNKTTLYSGNDAFAFISSNSKGVRLEVAKEFLKFLNTDNELAEFDIATSIPRSLNYTMSKEQKDRMTYFGRSVLEMKQSADIVYPYSNNSFYVNNSEIFMLTAWGWRSIVDRTEYDNPFTVFLNDGQTARKYFEGLDEVSR